MKPQNNVVLISLIHASLAPHPEGLRHSSKAFQTFPSQPCLHRLFQLLPLPPGDTQPTPHNLVLPTQIISAVSLSTPYKSWEPASFSALPPGLSRVLPATPLATPPSPTPHRARSPALYRYSCPSPFKAPKSCSGRLSVSLPSSGPAALALSSLCSSALPSLAPKRRASGSHILLSSKALSAPPILVLHSSAPRPAYSPALHKAYSSALTGPPSPAPRRIPSAPPLVVLP